jgi:two-component system chemotaxis response regulator CheY
VTAMKALIIDDSRAMRLILARSLKALGYAITEAGNGQEGLDAVAASGPFTVAMVDWNMPVMDGLEFITKTRASAATRGMRIVMVTTETEYDQIDRALKAGADEYLMKPFPPEAVAEKLVLLGLRAA